MDSSCTTLVALRAENKNSTTEKCKTCAGTHEFATDNDDNELKDTCFLKIDDCETGKIDAEGCKVCKKTHVIIKDTEAPNLYNCQPIGAQEITHCLTLGFVRQTDVEVLYC